MRLRAPIESDAPAVFALIVERDIADLGAPDVTLEDLQDEWSLSHVDLAQDARVVEAADGQIAGYALTREPGTIVLVAPGHEGLGIGTSLRRWAEQRERERGRPHRQWIASTNTRGQDLLLAAGYRRVRSYWRLARELGELEPPASPPDGVSLRPVEPDRDQVAIHTLSEASFASSSDYQTASFEVFSEEEFQAHDFAPHLSLLAESVRGGVGFLLARRWEAESVGFVSLLGVHPDHRAAGLGTALLTAAFARFAAAGLGEAQLGVASDNPGALRLYQRCGMVERFRYDTYERPWQTDS